jgi:hypothetical protein
MAPDVDGPRLPDREGYPPSELLIALTDHARTLFVWTFHPIRNMQNTDMKHENMS